MLRFLKKHGYTNFSIFNRTLSKAEKLVEEVGGQAYRLEDLAQHQGGLDLLLTCTGAEDAVITREIYEKLVGEEKTKPKIVVDLAIPHDLDRKVGAHFPVEHISIDFLQQLSKHNLKERTKEIIKAEHIIAEAVFAFRKLYQERQVELAMSEVPKKIKEIKATALQHVFSNELATLDGNSRETLEKIIDYMEKKYISVPMKMAKEIILNK
jgi:glutamyl-tRNA reductase